MKFDISKELKNIYIFEPDGENYKVYPEGREICYEGDKLLILYKMTKKFPTLKNAMAYLMDKEVPFFYDPFLNSFRTYKKGSNKEFRNRAIGKYYYGLMPFIHAYNAGVKSCRNDVNDLDTFVVNPYISMIRFDNKTVLNEDCSNFLQNFTEETEKDKKIN